MLYFAYGSNLSSDRLRARVPSAVAVAVGRLSGHCLLFHKIGRDGSAKCDALFTGRQEDAVLGAVYRINPDERYFLNLAEGLGNGYETKEVTVYTDAGSLLQAFTYYATRIAADLRPFDWYREHVLQGAQEHGLPADYIQCIREVTAIPDHDQTRAALEMAIHEKRSRLNQTGGI